jgi:hypothetical protein
MTLDPTIVAIIGIFLGCFARTVFPYLKKVEEDPDTVFDKKYLVSLLIALISSIIGAILIIPSFQIPQGANMVVFSIAFTTGWGTNDILNEIAGGSGGTSESKGQG